MDASRKRREESSPHSLDSSDELLALRTRLRANRLFILQQVLTDREEGSETWIQRVCRVFRRVHLSSVVEERSHARCVCGYPLCGRQLSWRGPHSHESEYSRLASSSLLEEEFGRTTTSTDIRSSVDRALSSSASPTPYVAMRRTYMGDAGKRNAEEEDARRKEMEAILSDPITSPLNFCSDACHIRVLVLARDTIRSQVAVESTRVRSKRSMREERGGASGMKTPLSLRRAGEEGGSASREEERDEDMLTRMIEQYGADFDADNEESSDEEEDESLMDFDLLVENDIDLDDQIAALVSEIRDPQSLFMFDAVETSERLIEQYLALQGDRSNAPPLQVERKETNDAVNASDVGTSAPPSLFSGSRLRELDDSFSTLRSNSASTKSPSSMKKSSRDESSLNPRPLLEVVVERERKEDEEKLRARENSSDSNISPLPSALRPSASRFRKLQTLKSSELKPTNGSLNTKSIERHVHFVAEPHLTSEKDRSVVQDDRSVETSDVNSTSGLIVERNVDPLVSHNRHNAHVCAQVPTSIVHTDRVHNSDSGSDDWNSESESGSDYEWDSGLPPMQSHLSPFLRCTLALTQWISPSTRAYLRGSLVVLPQSFVSSSSSTSDVESSGVFQPDLCSNVEYSGLYIDDSVKNVENEFSRALDDMSHLYQHRYQSILQTLEQRYSFLFRILFADINQIQERVGGEEDIPLGKSGSAASIIADSGGCRSVKVEHFPSRDEVFSISYVEALQTQLWNQVVELCSTFSFVRNPIPLSSNEWDSILFVFLILLSEAYEDPIRLSLRDRLWEKLSRRVLSESRMIPIDGVVGEDTIRATVQPFLRYFIDTENV